MLAIYNMGGSITIIIEGNKEKVPAFSLLHSWSNLTSTNYSSRHSFTTIRFYLEITANGDRREEGDLLILTRTIQTLWVNRVKEFNHKRQCLLKQTRRRIHCKPRQTTVVNCSTKGTKARLGLEGEAQGSFHTPMYSAECAGSL